MSALKGAIRKAFKDMEKIHKITKCASCECLLDVLHWLEQDLANIEISEAKSVRNEIQGWLVKGNQQRHNCLGCEVCLPTEPYNQFSAVYNKEMGQSEVAKENSVCGCSDT